MYNFAFAFVICAVVYIIGEVLSALTKAWIPSVFITAVLFLLGYWTILPHDVVSDAYLSFGGTLGIYFCIVHVGTLLSIKQLLAQWKTIVVCLTGLAGMRRHRGNHNDERGSFGKGYGAGCGFCNHNVLHPRLCRLSADIHLPSD